MPRAGAREPWEGWLPMVITMDGDRRAIVIDGNVVDLTNLEFAVMSRLVAANGRVVSYDRLISAMYGQIDEPMNATAGLMNTLQRTRRKLHPHGCKIVTRWGLGLMLERAGAA